MKPTTPKEPREPECRIESAFAVLQYTNSLIQFADQKAGTLIVINSIFIATMGASYAPRPLRLVFFGACLISLFGCILVILARRGIGPPQPPDLIFFRDILQQRSARDYVRHFQEAPAASFEEALLLRIHQAAEIADDKFRRYSLAVRACVVATLLWVVNIGWSVVGAGP
jgi:hypothetical protein